MSKHEAKIITTESVQYGVDGNFAICKIIWPSNGEFECIRKWKLESDIFAGRTMQNVRR